MKRKEWMEEKSAQFFEDIGLKKSDKILDFGCGRGTYTIAISKYLNEEGEVFALDKNGKSIREVREKAENQKISSIRTIKTEGEKRIPVESNYFNFVILYDVIHLLKNRRNLYDDIYRVLKKDGVLSIYPTHYGSKSVIKKIFGHKMNKNLDEIIKEVEKEGFYLDNILEREVMHNRSVVKGKILNFKKKVK